MSYCARMLSCVIGDKDDKAASLNNAVGAGAGAALGTMGAAAPGAAAAGAAGTVAAGPNNSGASRRKSASAR